MQLPPVHFYDAIPGATRCGAPALPSVCTDHPDYVTCGACRVGLALSPIDLPRDLVVEETMALAKLAQQPSVTFTMAKGFERGTKLDAPVCESCGEEPSVVRSSDAGLCASCAAKTIDELCAELSTGTPNDNRYRWLRAREVCIYPNEDDDQTKKPGKPRRWPIEESGEYLDRAIDAASAET